MQLEVAPRSPAKRDGGDDGQRREATMTISQPQIQDRIDPVPLEPDGSPSRTGSLLSSLHNLGPLALPIVWVVAWILALTHAQASGYHADQGWTVNAIRWMLYLPAGWMFIVSGVMHTRFAKKTAAMIGWQTNGFQYELGFVSFGLGLAGIYASTHGSQSWIAVAIPTTTFLFFAGVNHVVEMVRHHNFNPGNTFVCISDFGLPISLWALLLAAHVA
jgi:hypothetical protein